MKKIFCILFIAFVLSGCFDIYVYIIPLKDNSYILSERVSFGLDVLTLIGSLNSMDSMDLSAKKEIPTPKQMMDSMLAHESGKDSAFEKLPGYLGYSKRDSLFDTTAFFITDIHIRSADDIAEYMKDAQSEKNTSGELTVDLKVSHPEGMTKFDFVASKGKTRKKDNSNIIDMSKLESGGLHIGVLSENLQPPPAKTAIKPIPGGYEWFIPFTSLKNWERVKTKKVQFLVKK